MTRRGGRWRWGCLLGSVLAAWASAPAGAQVVLTNVAGYHAGGGPCGGGHPTTGAYAFTVPEGKDRFLLVLAPPEHNPTIPREVTTQREYLRAFTYAGKPLTCMTAKGKEHEAYGGVRFWYLADPPAGTHKLEFLQHIHDNGGENRMAAMALTGVDPKDPLGKELVLLTDKSKTIEYVVHSRPGGLVVDSLFYPGRKHRYYRIMPGRAQRLLWENCHDYRYEWMGSAAPGADRVEMQWRLAGRARCRIRAFALNPSKPGKIASATQPLAALPDGKTAGAKPGLVARVYDLSADPPRPSVRRQNYKSPALGSKIPDFDPKTPRAAKVIGQVDFHPQRYLKNPRKRPAGKGILDSGLDRQFVLECRGLIDIPETGEIMFKLLSVDQARLLIDGRLVVDNHGHNYNTLKTGLIKLAKGKHAFRLTNVEDAMNFGLSLGWRLPGGHEHGIPRGRKAPIAVIPPTAFSHTPEHLKPPGK